MTQIYKIVYLAAFMLFSFCSYGQKSFDGIDVSRHQGVISWKEVANSIGTDKFIYIKCTEGATYTDPLYKKNAIGAKKAGFLVGGYHYFRMTSTPVEQFENFKKALKSIDIDLIPMVDVERADGKSAKELQKNLKTFLDLIEKEFGVKPMIYGTNKSYNQLCAPAFNQYPLYIGRYGNNQPLINGKPIYTIWQFSETTVINGIQKPVDACRFKSGKSIQDIKLN